MWFQGEGGERVMGRGETRRRRRQQVSGKRNGLEICGKERNGREGLKLKWSADINLNEECRGACEATVEFALW